MLISAERTVDAVNCRAAPCHETGCRPRLGLDEGRGFRCPHSAWRPALRQDRRARRPTSRSEGNNARNRQGFRNFSQVGIGFAGRRLVDSMKQSAVQRCLVVEGEEILELSERRST